jgi:osmotically-inducible protein OsmY
MPMVRKHGAGSAVLALILGAGLAPAIVGCAETPTSRSTGEVIDDAAIKTKVEPKLLADAGPKALQVGVDVYQGNVDLKGVVDSPELVARAVEDARSVEGVRSVRNDLVVQ